MLWRGNRKSSNVEDRRNMHVSGSGRISRDGGGVLRLVPVIFKFLGFKGALILAVCRCLRFIYRESWQYIRYPRFTAKYDSQ